MNVKESKPALTDISLLKPYAKNVKKHDAAQVKRLAQSISKFGWRGNPIIVDSDYVIISGHGRRLAALELGLTKVPVVVESDMSAEEARAFRLADNRAAISDIDNDLLQEELIDLDTDLLIDIFDKKELEFAVADLMTVNEGVFVDDLDTVMDDQQRVTDDLIDKSADKRVSLFKVFGFKDVSGEDAIHITRFIAFIEGETGKQGADALVEFARKVVSHP